MENKNEIKKYLKKELGLSETSDFGLLKKIEESPELKKKAKKLLDDFLDAIR